MADELHVCKPADDGIRELAVRVVDFVLSVGLTDAREDEILQLVIAAYRAGQRAASRKPAARGYLQ